MSFIHPTALVSDKAKIGSNVYIGAYTCIGDRVEIADNCDIGQFNSIGTPPEIRDYIGKTKKILIGQGTTIREFVTIHLGTERETSIAEDCYIMGRSHIAHDCVVNKGVTISHGAILGGHSTIMQYANLGLNCVLHQRTTIGHYAMIAAGAVVVKDILPLSKYIPNKPVGINVHAIKKYKLFSEDDYTTDHKMPTNIDAVDWEDLHYRSDFESMVQEMKAVRDKSRDIHEYVLPEKKRRYRW